MENYEVFEEDKLNSFKKNQLVNLVLQLQKETIALKQQKETDLEKRVIALERSQYLYEQYGRRESVEISGIPSNIEQKDLENEVIQVFNEAKVRVHGRPLDPMDITACHRIGKKNVTIVRFVNRKFAYAGLTSGKNLKGTRLYGENNPIYINNSFCKEFSRYGYLIRKLQKLSLIAGYKVKNGVFFIKQNGTDNFKEVSHISDFEKYNLDIEAIQ